MNKIRWPTLKYIASQAQKSDLAALKCSAAMYKLKMKATAKSATKHNDFFWCAACVRFGKILATRGCQLCPLRGENEKLYTQPEECCCDGLWVKYTRSIVNPEKAELARQIYEFIMTKIKELEKKRA